MTCCSAQQERARGAPCWPKAGAEPPPKIEGEDANEGVVPKMLPAAWVCPNAALLAPNAPKAGAEAAPNAGADCPKPKPAVEAAPKAGAEPGEPKGPACWGAPKAGADWPKPPAGVAGRGAGHGVQMFSMTLRIMHYN